METWLQAGGAPLSPRAYTHSNPDETLLVPQASPGGQRVETWLQAGGAPLSPRAYTHSNPDETLLVPQASPGRQRVETWLQAGGAPLSPRTYRARALAELSRSTTFLERRHAPHHAIGGPLHGSDGAAGPGGGAHAERPRFAGGWRTFSFA